VIHVTYGLIRPDYETLSVAAMRIRNPDYSPARIQS
jgi:hypothetical protein